MQQLYHIAKQRYSALLKVSENQDNQTSEKYREMREEQKQRCEKQSWILSMLRSKKRQITPQLKKSIYHYSYLIMRVADSNFTMNSTFGQGGYQNSKNQSVQNDENFLNTLVCLYTKFFDQFQRKLAFKVKIKSLLRPTNHNVINDLVKYLIDFTRDYCQYLVYLRIKNNQKQSQRARMKKNSERDDSFQEERDSLRKLSQNQRSTFVTGFKNSIVMVNSTKLLKQENQKNNDSLKKSPISSLSTHMTNSSPEEEQPVQANINSKKKQFQKLYGILDIQPPSNFVLMEKSKSNLDVIKLKMNEMYRDIKFRNNMVKASLQEYLNRYGPNKNNQNNKQYILEDSSYQVSYPFRVSLVIEKNGFSCLNLGLANERGDRNLSPLKDHKNRSSSLSNRQGSNISNNFRTTTKTDFLLSSLKVIRVSESSLPPIQQNLNIQYKSSAKLLNKYSNFPMMLDNYDTKKVKNERMNTSSLIESELRQKLGINIDKIEINNTIKPPNQELDSQSEKKYGPIYYSYNYSYNQQTIRQAQRKKQQKKRISQIRRHFTSEQKMKNSKKKLHDPEQKLVEWLDKINLMKQLQKKKILGLN